MRVNVNEVRRAALACGVLLAAALTASCGGGSQQSTFTASRLIAFGDETSVLDDSTTPGNARKYSVNGTLSSTDPTIDCTQNPTWVQSLAGHYGLTFPQCVGGIVGAPASRIRATFGAKAADLAAQIDAQQNESGMTTGDLATVLVGGNDVIEQYLQYPAISEPQLTANVQAAGAEVGRQVNRLVTFDVRVVVSTTPDVGYTPFAVNELATHVDTDRQALLKRLNLAFNSSLRSTIANDGRHIGLVTMDELVETVGTFVGVDGFINSTVGACDLNQSLLTPPSILDCSDLTLIPGATSLTYLWADDRHLSYGGQAVLANLAISRVTINPF